MLTVTYWRCFLGLYMVLQASRFYIPDFSTIWLRLFFFCYHRLDLPFISSTTFTAIISFVYALLYLHAYPTYRISSFHGLFSTFYNLRSPHFIDYVLWIGKPFISSAATSTVAVTSSGPAFLLSHYLWTVTLPDFFISRTVHHLSSFYPPLQLRNDFFSGFIGSAF
jgi:hypothetical protein